jgi:hypothetical protein
VKTKGMPFDCMVFLFQIQARASLSNVHAQQWMHGQGLRAEVLLLLLLAILACFAQLVLLWSGINVYALLSSFTNHSNEWLSLVWRHRQAKVWLIVWLLIDWQNWLIDYSVPTRHRGVAFAVARLKLNAIWEFGEAKTPWTHHARRKPD